MGGGIQQSPLVQQRMAASGQDAAEVRPERLQYTAVGILMTEHKINSDEAFELLTTASHTLRRKLRDIGAEVATTGALPRPTRRMAHAGRN